MKDYRQVADAVAEEIRTGGLRPGDRLPPQREFARGCGIADSTAARVYRELARRGLTVGEVGRGTYVRAARAGVGPALSEPAGSRIDLELNHPVVPEQAALLATGLGGLLRPDVLQPGAAGGRTPGGCCSRATVGRHSPPCSARWCRRGADWGSRS